MQAAHRLIDRMGHLDNQPMIIDVGNAGVISVVGDPARTDLLTRALLCQIAVLHAPDDVTLVIETASSEHWEWTKWLPHTFEPDARSDSGSVSLVAEGPDVLATFLQAELTSAPNCRPPGVMGSVAIAPPPSSGGWSCSSPDSRRSPNGAAPT